MKTVILCGGRGTRLGEHGRTVPKALITIGGKPIIWHILKVYSHYGLNEFILCIGYLGDEIRRYFELSVVDPNWTVELLDTGLETNTGGRLKRAEPFLAKEESFCVTYGDGLADIPIDELIRFHSTHGKIATVSAVHPHSNFGLMEVDQSGRIAAFCEKPVLKEWINGGFFVFDLEILRYLEDDSTLESKPFEELSRRSEMMAFRHEGFWKCMDTFKDNLEFEQLWAEDPPWKVW